MTSTLSRLLALTVLLTSGTAQEKERVRPEAWVDPVRAAVEDPDFSVQGEWSHPSLGIQVVALGGDRFRIVSYRGGLPGQGWNRKDRFAKDAVGAELRKFLANKKKVQRRNDDLGAEPPENAIVLFDGTEESLRNWQEGARMTPDGLLVQGATSIPKFGDARVHVEFRLPYMPHARGQGRGNSGLYLQGRYELQMLDSFGLEGKNDECGGIYSVRAPDLNMCLPPLTWQTYDIDFTSAVFDADGKKTKRARVTVRLNGVVIHDDVEIPKETTASPLEEGPDPGPVFLQDHGNPVRYRNIWVVPR